MSTVIAGGLTNTPTDPSLFGGATPEQVAAAVADYIAKNPVNAPSAEQIASAVEEYLKNNPISGGVDAEQLTQAVNAALQTAKESGEFDGPQGYPGKDGTSVTILSISESEDDEDVNVVVFSDGKTLNIKNGKTGKTPVKGEDYFTPSDKAEMVNAVLSAFPTWKGGSY